MRKIKGGSAEESELEEKNGVSPAEMTVPRLEFCAAVLLLSRQIKTMRETIGSLVDLLSTLMNFPLLC